jgi:hypothetical protein
MEIDNKLFNLYKEKAINVVNSQLTFVATYILILFSILLGGLEKEYFIEIVAMTIFIGVAYYTFCDLKYREYRRNYINILVLSSIKDISKPKKKKELISILSNKLYISKKCIEISIDDLVNRELLSISTVEI